MQPTNDDAPSRSQQRTPWQKIVFIYAVIIICAPIAVFGGFVAWFAYEMTRNEVIIMVDNQSNAPVDAMLFDTGAFSPTVTLKAVAPGQQADHDQNTWRVIGSTTFRVRIGTQEYEGNAGTLLDDDGPHRFWVKAFDDRVVVTRQSNERPWGLKMIAMGSATRPAR